MPDQHVRRGHLLRHPRAVLGAVVLVVASLVLTPAPAFASPSVAASSVDAGQPATIVVNGCADGSRYTGATFQIADSGGTVVDEGAVPDWTFTWTTNDPDLYTVTVTCEGYNSAADATTTTTFAMWPTFIDISPDSWTLGEPITLQGVGFTPGENVEVRLSSDATGAVISSWATTSIVDDSALWTFQVTLPPSLGEGVYFLAATGTQSGVTRTGGLRIVDTGVATPTPTTVPGRGGLPNTGE